MHIILTGATGTIGSAALQHCLASPKVTQLSILSRRQFDLPTDAYLDIKKARVIVHDDYTTYPETLLKTLQGAQGCIWAQGISQNDVAKDEYVRITYDYPLAAAKAFSSLSPNTGNFNFVYVSGEGADPTEKAWTFFGKIKGRAEKDLLALPATTPPVSDMAEASPAYGALRIFNVRPGYVDPQYHHRPRSAVQKHLVDGMLGPILRRVMPGSVSPTAELSKVLLDLATGDGEPLKVGEGAGGGGIEAGGRTVRSVAVRRLGVAS